MSNNARVTKFFYIMSQDKLPRLISEQDAGHLQIFLDELAQERESFKLEFDKRPLTEEVVKEQIDEKLAQLEEMYHDLRLIALDLSLIFIRQRAVYKNDDKQDGVS
jgi:hypothetical protein